MCVAGRMRAAAATASKRMCVQYLVLKGWKEKHSPGRQGGGFLVDVKGVILMWAASRGWGRGEEFLRVSGLAS